MTALMVLVRFLSHAGHISVGDSAEDLGFGIVLKFMVIRDLRDCECLFSGDDAGHNGESLSGLASCELFVDGVSDGTQKEGKVGLAAFKISVIRIKPRIWKLYLFIVQRLPRFRPLLLHILQHLILIQLKLPLDAP